MDLENMGVEAFTQLLSIECGIADLSSHSRFIEETRTEARNEVIDYLNEDLDDEVLDRDSDDSAGGVGVIAASMVDAASQQHPVRDTHQQQPPHQHQHQQLNLVGAAPDSANRIDDDDDDDEREEDNMGNGGRISLYTEERWYGSIVTMLLGFRLHNFRSCSSANSYEAN
mmetsp:Transcript_31460/g.33805  ORF Transcript_31460/g.33805 Transcript_31460/m.33805 type:complete len:170 (+) Transcript_31460:3-512(+)